MSRPAMPVGTVRLHPDGRTRVKTEDGWVYSTKHRRRPRKGRVVAFEVSHEEWAWLERVVAVTDYRSVAHFARHRVLGDPLNQSWPR